MEADLPSPARDARGEEAGLQRSLPPRGPPHGYFLLGVSEREAFRTFAQGLGGAPVYGARPSAAAPLQWPGNLVA